MITFVDGSNPYVCKTKEEFSNIKEKYVLRKMSENTYLATKRIMYSICGWADLEKPANIIKYFETKGDAMRFAKKLRKNKDIKKMVMRRDYSSLNNHEDLEISDSESVFTWLLQ
jgi:hypothetical protein